ncbi:hypothetical protein CC86DRAFT_292918 [Ophiobolus disseminans]|uniref:Uncharacterized protein n=1 Tax=Ophiobolus disseminans TaxID=1469910 RepID=A0A6A7A0E6_9PLEO|nr:hypothetical protein CC86DRAFT_292918 [Ophiobolus disseminans]
MSTPTPKHTLPSLTTTLLQSTRLTTPPQHSTFPSLTAAISALRLHPTLEAALHIANSDLPSAHFLVRHMQAPPAVEGMLLHGILHRAEGDFANARAWMGDVADACGGWVPKKRGEGEKLDAEVFERMGVGKGVRGSLIEYVYGEADAEGLGLVDDVEAFRKGQGGYEMGELEDRARKELEAVLEWCKAKFGEGAWEDARSAWVENSEEVREISEGMVSGKKGRREF